MFLTVNTQAVDAVVLHKLLDPVVVSGLHSRVFGLEISKRNDGVSKPAMLDTRIIAEINGTIGMILGLKKILSSRNKLKRAINNSPLP